MRFLFALCLLLSCLMAQAQVFESSSQEISEEEAQELFTIMKQEDAKMGDQSECFQRAHMWALRAERLHNVTMEKAFLFFTFKFSMRHRVTRGLPWSRAFTWWFHVAPAVRVNGELWVLDATFTDRAMPLQEWAGSLMRDPEVCEPMNDPKDYVTDRNASRGFNSTVDVPQCYFTVAPRFIYQPLEIGLRDSRQGMQFTAPLPVPADWESYKLKWGLEAYKSQHRRAARQALGI